MPKGRGVLALFLKHLWHCPQDASNTKRLRKRSVLSNCKMGTAPPGTGVTNTTRAPGRVIHVLWQGKRPFTVPRHLHYSDLSAPDVLIRHSVRTVLNTTRKNSAFGKSIQDAETTLGVCLNKVLFAHDPVTRIYSGQRTPKWTNGGLKQRAAHSSDSPNVQEGKKKFRSRSSNRAKPPQIHGSVSTKTEKHKFHVSKSCGNNIRTVWRRCMRKAEGGLRIH
mmetsp:Transcript_38655/g.64251  ORF Transcript_38655/g.64251 Transcript_38655/m.64251 type:complete len:221 (+) Transcript_38655:214-876(+)